MKLKCIGSGSTGNCYLLESDAECLVIEAGLPFMEVKKALDFNIRKIVGVVASHCHFDHSKAVTEYEKAGIPVFKPYESDMNKQVRTYGSFAIKSFELEHDVPCCGFYIYHPDMGKLVYITDTEYCKYKFKGLNHILVEANHSLEMIDRDSAKYEHQITGHMNIDTACDFIKANSSAFLRNVVLIHLSQESGDKSIFLEKARRVTGSNVFVAEKNLCVSLNLCPFL